MADVDIGRLVESVAVELMIGDRNSGSAGGEPRVLMVLNRYHPMVGGAERQCESLCAHLGAQVRVVGLLTHRYAAELPRSDVVAGVDVVRLGRPSVGQAPKSFYLCLAWQAWRRAAGYDLIHCHTAGFTGMWLALVARLLGKPILLKLTAAGELSGQVTPAVRGSGWIHRARAAIRRRLARAALASNGTHVLVLTPAGGDEAVAAGARSVHLIANGVDSSRFKPPTSPRRVDGRPIEFGYAGRLTVEKGLPVLLSAFSRLLREGATVKLKVVGTSTHQLNPADDGLHMLKSEFPDRIDVHPPVDDTAAFLHGVDAYVSASTYEGLPNAVLEALASGLPCVLSDIDGHRELQRLNPAGRFEFFEPGNANDCAAAILRLTCERPWPHSELAAAMRIDLIAQGYATLYRALVSAPAGKGRR